MKIDIYFKNFKSILYKSILKKVFVNINIIFLFLINNNGIYF